MSDELNLPARITVNNASVVMQSICLGVEPGVESQLVDLSLVNYCDSAGIAALIEAKIQSQKNATTLIYQHPHSQLQDLATFLKVNQLLFA